MNPNSFKFNMVVGDSHIWNEYELLDFLVQHQGENIIISTNGEGCCAQSIGLYKLLDLFKFKSVTIYTLNNAITNTTNWETTALKQLLKG